MKTIMCYGDSNTWGYMPKTDMPQITSANRFPWDVRWTGRLQAMLGAAYRVLEAILRPLTALGMMFTDLFVPRKDAKYRLTSDDLLRILQDRKDGVCLSDFESALITRIIVLRVKGKPITPEAILSAIRDVD